MTDSKRAERMLHMLLKTRNRRVMNILIDSGRAMTVKEIEIELNDDRITQSVTSLLLRELRMFGLVRRKKDGRHRLYYPNYTKLSRISRCVHDFLKGYDFDLKIGAAAYVPREKSKDD